MSRLLSAASVKLISTSLIGLALTGCVAQEKYNAARLEIDRLNEQNALAQNEASAAKAEADSLRKQLDAINGTNGGAQSLIGNLTAQNAELNRQMDELRRRYDELMGKSSKEIALPEPLNNALVKLAADNPDLLEFDPARGVLRFKSDVTFASGDASLTARAKDVITRFASILNTQARGFEFIVAGHTDNVPVSNPQTIKMGHKDNWYLSAHRAISVSEALLTAGVSPARLGVTGYADQRPVAANATPEGKARNRRVEVLILPPTIKLATPAAAADMK